MVYLIHFNEPLAHAQHYIGYTENGHTFNSRMEHHANGQGSRLMRAVNQAGIEYDVVRVWKKGDRTFERRLKNQKNARRFCPVCNPYHCYGRLKDANMD